MTEINDYINNDYKALNSQETIADVQDFFADVSYSHFSVVEEGVYIGCIAADDIETFDSDKKIIDYKYALEGLFISDVTANKVQITIKIAMGGINEIIQTFRRYNYEIITEHQEDNYLNSLKERSEYLDKYLNI